MTKDEFYEKFSNELLLETKSWDFIQKGNREKGYVAVSAYREIDKNFLYYDYLGIIYEVNLTQIYEGRMLRYVLKEILASKKSTTSDIVFNNRPDARNNMVFLKLNVFGSVVGKSIALPKIIDSSKTKQSVSEVFLDEISKEISVDNEKLVAQMLGISLADYKLAKVSEEILSRTNMFTNETDKIWLLDKLKELKNE